MAWRKDSWRMIGLFGNQRGRSLPKIIGTSLVTWIPGPQENSQRRRKITEIKEIQMMLVENGIPAIR
jgi:hypothetical protein